MVLAKANLALETRVLAEPVARLTFVIFRFQDLARGLMLELIVFAQVARAEGTAKNAAAVLPHAALTFDADSVRQRTRAGVRSQTFLPVTDPGFAEITNCSLKIEDFQKVTWVNVDISLFVTAKFKNMERVLRNIVNANFN